MDKSDNYNEGCSMQRPPLLETEGFCYWKQRFETYVCAKDIDLWDRIVSGDYEAQDWSITDKKWIEVEKKDWKPEHKQNIAKNYEAKLMLYNALPRKEYERVFMCKSAKEAWDTLVVTHQGNAQVIESKIELLVAQYEQFAIGDDEKIDVGYSRFNTICTSLKALGTIYTPKQYVRKFLRALPSKWRPKVTAIDEAKDFEKLSLDELVGNLKVHEVILEKDEEIARLKKEKFKSIALKAKHQVETSSEENEDEIDEDEELACMVRNFKRVFRRSGKFVRPPQNDSRKAPSDVKKKVTRKCFNCGDPSHLVNECTKKRNERAYVSGAWEDEEGEEEEAQEKCFMAIDQPETVEGAWSDSEEEDSIVCLVGQDDDEVLSYDKYSIEDLENDYEKLAMLSTNISKKNGILKSENKSLTQELDEQKRLVAILMKENSDLRKSQTQVHHTCEKCPKLRQKVKVFEKELCFIKFAKGTKMLDDMLDSIQRRHGNEGIGYNSKLASKEVKPTIFVKEGENRKSTDAGTAVRAQRPQSGPAKHINQRSTDARTDVRAKRPWSSDLRPQFLPNVRKATFAYKPEYNSFPRVEKPHIMRRFYQTSNKFGNHFANLRNYSSNTYHRQQRTYRNHLDKYYYQETPKYNLSQRMTKKWVKIGMFNANNPGPMKHWVPKF